MTLEEIIRKRLDEATKTVELKEPKVEPEDDGKETKDVDDVEPKPTLKKPLCKEDAEVDPVAVVKESSTVSDQVAALLEAEGLSEEFKTQAVTIFEAAVTDRVLQIKEGLEAEFDIQLSEAKKELENDIDGFLSEAIQKWKAENEVAIKSNFKTQLAESFMDGVYALLAEHNVELPEGKEDALATALSEVDKLNEAKDSKDDVILSLTEQVNALKSEKILESFKEKMTQTEFDRFVQLTESVKFTDESQYEKQLGIVMENFGSTKKVQESKQVITEDVVQPTEIKKDNSVSIYADFLSKNKR